MKKPVLNLKILHSLLEESDPIPRMKNPQKIPKITIPNPRFKPKEFVDVHNGLSKPISVVLENQKEFRNPKKRNLRNLKKTTKEEKLPEDGVLAIDKFLLKRYNSLQEQCEYLVQWNGYDIHRSTWLAKQDIFAADYLNEFEEEWANRLKERKENPPPQTHPSAPKQYAVGDKVWVKLKGHQWWPAQIVVHSEIDNGKNDYTVVFYGDNTFAFVNDYDTKDFSIEPFEGANAARYAKKQNEKAVKEALAMLPNGPE